MVKHSISSRIQWICPLVLLMTSWLLPSLDSLSGGSASCVWGQERPKAVDLLPERTVVYVHIDNLRQLTTQFWETGMGQMLQDERVAPLVNELYGETKAAYEKIQSEVGDFSLEQLQSLPTGEICFAIINPRRSDPGYVLLMDVDQESGTADEVLDFINEKAAEDESRLDDTQEGVFTIHRSRIDDTTVHYVLHEGTFLACTHEKTMQTMLARWQGNTTEDECLAENRKFTTIMNKCRSTEDLPLAMSFYVDPIEIYRAYTRGNVGARAALGFLPLLGLDGVLGFGGAAIVNEGGYESIMHAHMLLANPRAGILKMIAMKPGVYQPEPFVPEDSVNYVTSHWSPGEFMSELEKIVDGFGGDGFYQEGIESIDEELGIDFQAQFLDNIEGRLTYFSIFLPDTVLNSQSHVGSLRVLDPETAKGFIRGILAEPLEEQNAEEKEYKGVLYWTRSEKSLKEREERRRRWREENDRPERQGVRDMRPSVGILDDYLVLSDSEDTLKAAIDCFREDAPTLIESELYTETTDHMLRLLDTQLPSASFFSRPDLSMRFIFDLVESEAAVDWMDQSIEEDEEWSGVVRAIKENPLPDFDELAEYFPPNGGFIVDDESGLHMLFFQVKPE